MEYLNQKNWLLQNSKLMHRILILTILSFHFSLATMAQQQGASIQFQKFDQFQKERPTEKIYIHTNREILSLGDTLWMSVYVVAGPYHLTSGISGLAYVELIDPTQKVISKLNIRLDSMGVGAGQFALADSLIAGTYYIRAYTNYMRNFSEEYFFTKSLNVQPRLTNQEVFTDSTISIENSISFQLFPEGGDLVSELPNKIAFKCADNLDRPLDISGVILDENENEITSFKTTHDGMGLILFTPNVEKKYTASFWYNGIQYNEPFPPIKSSGYIMSIRQSKEKIFLTVIASEGVGFENTLLLAHSRGKFFYEAEPSSNGKLMSVQFLKDSIPSGILHFTFFGSNGLPSCERLAFNDIMPIEIPLNIQYAKLNRKRSLMNFDIDIPEQLNASLSMSVVPLNIYKEVQANIHEYLMLTSDLKGFVNNPAHYFDQSNSNRIRDTDLLMMIHGWRRFSWPEILPDEIVNLSFFPESGFSVTGQVTGYVTRNKGKKLPLQLSFIENVMVTSELETDESGKFIFADLPVEDTMTVVIRAINGKKGEVEKSALININDTNEPVEINFLPPLISIDPVKANAAKEKGKELFDIKAAFDRDVIILDELSIISERDRFDDPLYRSYQLYSQPSSRMILDSIPGVVAFNNIFDIMRGRLKGVQVMGTYPNQSVMIRGQSSFRDNSVQFIFNGLPVSTDFINSLNVRDISHIDVLTGTEAMAYPLAATGVILIYTKEGHSTTMDRAQEGIAFQKIIGFHAPRQFYMPDYNNPTDEEKLRPDYRSTLYWNPLIRTEKGSAGVDFYTSDEAGEFIYVLEGITNVGSIIRKSGTFKVE